MSLYDLAIARLRAQRSQLEADLAAWAARASSEGDLPLHRSQVGRLQLQISSALDSALAGTPVAAEGSASADGTIADLPEIRRAVGTIHLLWDFFRDKLAQRDTAAYCAHLGVADDLAWACYEPFLAEARAAGSVTDQELKEPPLVFYSTDRAPYAQARTKALHPPGLDSKDLEQVSAELRRLPVPVIGMPWAVANKLPEVVLIGHEAGHVIAEDLKLAPELREVFTDVVLTDDDHGKRRLVWMAWRDEIFADMIGVLATGSAFLNGLAAEIAGAESEISQAKIETDRPGRYPTAALRVAVCTGVLEKLDIAPPRIWAETYGPLSGDSRQYERDVKAVVGALMDRTWNPIGGKRLAEVLPWTASREQSAGAVALAVLQPSAPPVTFDVRVWIAAAMHAALMNPPQFEAVEADKRLATYVIERRTDAVRSSRGHRSILLGEAHDRGQTGADAQMRTSDREAGRLLAERLRLHPGQ